MRDRGPAVFCRPRRWTALATGLAAAALAGCSFIPAGTGPQAASAPPPAPGTGRCCGLVVRPPQPGWQPQDVVKNFLLASAIAANNFAAARRYLTADAKRAWRPTADVTILTKEPQVSVQPGRLSGPGGGRIVVVTGQALARLRGGQYIPVPGGQPTETFVLQYVHGLYKIANLIPASPGKPDLMLTSFLFQQEYTPRNLYYYGLRTGKLLPYPVFVPIQGPNPAVTLINDLITGPSGWIAGAAQSAFPAGSHVVLPIQVVPGPSGGRTAIVNIAVPAHAGHVPKDQMATQLVATLTGAAYSTPLFRAVKIKFNGRPWHQNTALGRSVYEQQIPHLPTDVKAYYLSQGGALRSLSARAERGAVVANGGSGQVFSKIAVSPDGRHLAGLAGPTNALYTGELTTGPGDRQSVGQLHQQLTGTFSSLSWDNSGALWVVGKRGDRQGVWVLGHGQAPAYPVQLPLDLTGPVTSLRVAPDGVRVAMIVGQGAQAHLVLAAAMRDKTGFFLSTTAPLGSALPRPVSALTWYGEDHVLVITRSGEGSQYWDVPVDGDNPRSLIKQPGMTTVTAAGQGHPIYIGLENSGMERAFELNQSLAPITPGQAITYPG